MLIGLWLILRGASRSAGLIASRAPLVRPVVAGDGSAHHHHQDNVHGHCESCGHAHAPSPQVIAAASSAPELASVILAIAIRPCSGAILLLVLTWKMGILEAGIAGAFAMASGTASLTLLVAFMGRFLRGGVLSVFAESRIPHVIGATLEIAAGVTVVLLRVEHLVWSDNLGYDANVPAVMSDWF